MAGPPHPTALVTRGRPSSPYTALGDTWPALALGDRSELLFHIIPVQTTDFYVDASSGKPVPFFSSESILKGAFDVKFNSSYNSFTAANLTGHFDIDPTSFAACPRSPGCSGDSKVQTATELPAAVHRRFGKDAAPPILRPTPSTPPKTLPTLPSDYIAREETQMLSNVGGEFFGDDVCCLPNTSAVNGECLITRSAKRGTRYFDHTNQRERFDDEVSGHTMVTLYGDADKDMLINITDGVETCQEYCPLLPGETLEPLALDPNATDRGPATVPTKGGKSAEKFEWIEYAKMPFGRLVKMETIDFYAALEKRGASGVTATPVFSETKLTPYGGPQSGSKNTSFSEYKGVTPPASKFAIAGISACPQSKFCQIEMWQSFRLAAGRYDAFRHYQ